MRLLALAALLLAPSAAACSFAGELPPPPGAFVLTDLADGTEWRIEVEERWLGGTCELSNPFALSGGWIAWVDGPHGAPRVLAQDIHARGPTVDHPGGARALSLYDGVLLADDGARVERVDLETGAREPLPVQRGRETSVLFEGSLVLLAHGYGTAQRVSLWDDRERAWVFESLAFPQLGERWWPTLLGETWLLVNVERERSSERLLLDLLTQELRPFDAVPAYFHAILDIDGDDLYYAPMRDGEAWLDPWPLMRMRLPDGEPQRVAERATSVAAVADGLAVTRAFSPGHAEPLGVLGAPPAPALDPAPPTPPDEPRGEPPVAEPRLAVPHAAWLAVAALALAGRRRA